MGELLARHGADGLRALMDATMAHSERLTRHCLAELPDGEATFTDWIDDDQIDAGSRSRWSARCANAASIWRSTGPALRRR